MNYPLNSLNKEGSLLQSHHSYYSDECAQSHCSLYLSDEFEGDAYHNNIKSLYRLHAKEPHNIEMALAYDIKCPHCSGQLKQVGRQLNYHDLGLYECPACNKNQGGF